MVRFAYAPACALASQRRVPMLRPGGKPVPPVWWSVGMRQWVIAVVVSVLLAEWLEFWYRFGATWDPQVFWGALAPYTLMMMAFHAAIAWAPRWPRWVWLGIGCLPGMSLEWFVIGNSPWGNPDAWQLGQLAFHATYPLWGRMFDPDWFGPRQRRLALILLALFSVAVAPGFLITHPDVQFMFFIFAPLPFYFALAWIVVFNRPREG
jgi:hypothetical protein